MDFIMNTLHNGCDRSKSVLGNDDNTLLPAVTRNWCLVDNYLIYTTLFVSIAALPL